MGLAAKAWVEAWLAAAPPHEWPLQITTTKAQTFGRYLGRVWRMGDTESLNTAIVRAGMAFDHSPA
jgi:endonuclease YncB( thermonuclease family)